jgi:hypothetical protein
MNGVRTHNRQHNNQKKKDKTESNDLHKCGWVKWHIVLSVLLRPTDSDYHFGILKLFLCSCPKLGHKTIDRGLFSVQWF